MSGTNAGMDRSRQQQPPMDLRTALNAFTLDPEEARRSALARFSASSAGGADPVPKSPFTFGASRQEASGSAPGEQHKKKQPQHNMLSIFNGMALSSALKEAVPSVGGGKGGGAGMMEAGAAAGATAEAKGMGTPSASAILLQEKRARKRAAAALEEEMSSPLASAGGGAGKGKKRRAPLTGQMSRAVEMGQQDAEEEGMNERHLRTMAAMKGKGSWKQKRRRTACKAKGAAYEEKYKGKIITGAKRRSRLAALKTMY